MNHIRAILLLFVCLTAVAADDKPNPAPIQTLANHVDMPLEKAPAWNMAAIRSSRIIHHQHGSLPDKPKFKTDIDNLFIVVEQGNHHTVLLDSANFEPVIRVPTRFSVQSNLGRAAGRRYIYFLSQDGWVSKFDVFNLVWAAEIRVGIKAHSLAVSHDDRYVMIANYFPHTLVLLDAKDLTPIKVIETKDSKGNSSRVSAIHTANPRSSFIATMKDIPEVWEINYEDDPPVGFGKWVHDYRPDSGEETEKERFPIRKLPLKEILDDFIFTSDYDQIVGSAQGGAQVVDLDLGRTVARVKLAGSPHLGSALAWSRNGATVLAIPNIREPEIAVVDMTTWEIIRRIPTKGPGFFIRSHEKSPYLWTNVFVGPNRDLLHIIDKQSLEIVKTLKPAPGKTSAHVEFTRDGKYALVNIRNMDGAIVVYDAWTLKEVRRLTVKGAASF